MALLVDLIMIKFLDLHMDLPSGICRWNQGIIALIISLRNLKFSITFRTNSNATKSLLGNTPKENDIVD